VGPHRHGPQILPATVGGDGLPERAHERDGERERQGVYTLAIIDSGLGMIATDMEAANRRLAGAESFTVAPSKYLGHYVAGNLAARHGIGVRLDNSPGNGVTATVHIPPPLLTTDAVTSAPVTPPQGMRPSGVARAAGGPALPSPPAREPQPVPWPPDPVAPPAPGWGPVEPAARSSDQRPVSPSRSVFHAPAPGESEPPAWLTEPTHRPTRTASGLVKRPSVPGDGAQSPAAAAHAGSNEDLLASLNRFAGTSRSREQTGPPASGPPPPRPPRGNTFPPPWAEGIGSASGDHRLDLRSTQPMASPPPAPPSWSPPPGPASSPVPPAPPLTRRVRGAQLPPADPMLVRRGRVGAPGPPAHGPAPRRTMPAAADGR
jgi:hypothetical protein